MTDTLTLIAYGGEAWDELAVRAYGPGREREMARLLAANPDLIVYAELPAGVVVMVPNLPTPAPAQSLPPWKR